MKETECSYYPTLNIYRIMKKKGQIFRLAGKCIIKNAVIKWVGLFIQPAASETLGHIIFNFANFFPGKTFQFQMTEETRVIRKKRTPETTAFFLSRLPKHLVFSTCQCHTRAGAQQLPKSFQIPHCTETALLQAAHGQSVSV